MKGKREQVKELMNKSNYSPDVRAMASNDAEAEADKPIEALKVWGYPLTTLLNDLIKECRVEDDTKLVRSSYDQPYWNQSMDTAPRRKKKKIITTNNSVFTLRKSNPGNRTRSNDPLNEYGGSGHRVKSLWHSTEYGHDTRPTLESL